MRTSRASSLQTIMVDTNDKELLSGLTAPEPVASRCYGRFLSLVQTAPATSHATAGNERAHVDDQNLRTVPLFSGGVQKSSEERPKSTATGSGDVFPQFGLLGIRQRAPGLSDIFPPVAEEDQLVFANIEEPWSTFICGSQGSGKSHTLSCMLENCLLKNENLGN